MTNTTRAHIDDHVTIGTATTRSGGVAVGATDTTKILSLAGALAIGGTAGVGAGIDVEVISKHTEAWIGQNTSIRVTRNVPVDATSSEKALSLAVGGGFGGTAAVNVNVGVSVYDITTTASIDGNFSSADPAAVRAQGSIRVSADEQLKMDVIGGNIGGGGTAAGGAAGAGPVITKNTHAPLGGNPKVSA